MRLLSVMKNYKYFGARSQKKTKVKVLFIVLLVVLLCIPVIFAVIHYLERSESLLGANSVQVSLYYQDELLYEKIDNPDSEDADPLVVIFDSIVKQMTKADKLPDSLDSHTVFRVVLTKRDSVNEYVCYVSNDGATCYCVNSDGVIYHMTTKTADRFLNSEYSRFIYKSAEPPVLYSTSGDDILPVAADWKYKTISGNYLTNPTPKYNDGESVYNMSGSLGVLFDDAPDSCNVIIKNKIGVTVFQGEYTEISSTVTVESGTTLSFTVNAVWEQTENCDYFGEVTYQFDTVVRDRSQFIVDKTTVSTGDFIIVTCTNVFDSHKISFSSTPEIDIFPIFIEDRGVVRTLIPLERELEVGEYNFKFTYGATEEIVKIDLVSDGSSDMEYFVASKNKNAFYDTVSDSSIDELNAVIEKDMSDISDRIFFRDSFVNMSEEGAYVYLPFGAQISVVGDSQKFVSEGIQYKFANKNNAYAIALNSGIVLDVGYCNYLGNYVVIDHGIGLRTLYGHLEQTFVNIGDTVAKGEMLGACGAIDETSPKGVFIMCFIYDVPINYELLSGKTISFYHKDDNLG